MNSYTSLLNLLHKVQNLFIENLTNKILTILTVNNLNQEMTPRKPFRKPPIIIYNLIILGVCFGSL